MDRFYRLLCMMLPFLWASSAAAQCGFTYEFYQTGNCYLIGFDIGVVIGGGTGPYSITWYASGNQVGTDSQIPVEWTLNSAEVTVEVTDAMGCTESGTQFWIDPGIPVTADVLVQPDPLDCSNNVVTLQNVNATGSCGGVLVAIDSPTGEIGDYTQSPIVMTGFPPGTHSLFLVPTSGTCGLCPTVLTIEVPNTCGPNTISGKVYLDNDNSCGYTTGEPSIPGAFVLANGVQSQLVGSGSNGNYTAHLNTGTYTVGIPNLNNLWSVSCPIGGSYTVNIPPNTTGLDFGLSPVGSVNDLEVSMTGTGPCRPGWNTQVVITCRNVGNTSQGGTLLFAFDLLLGYVSSSPLAASQNGNSITWNVQLLQPFSQASFTASLSVPPTATAGTQLSFMADLTASGTDEHPADNNAALQRMVTASFDPNDKQVMPEGDLMIQDALAGQTLDYVVRFQNTGNDVAIDVRIEDEIDPLLDLGTFEVIGASHAWTAAITERSAVFRFDNINLPDSGSDFDASQGFIRYRIAPAQGVMVNDVITNTAAIFFDYNEPVITNTVSTTLVDLTTATPYHQGSELTVLRHDGSMVLRSDAAIGSVDVHDITGRLVGTLPGGDRGEVHVPLDGRAVAVYILRVYQANGISTIRVVP
jgi:uncharacterized repeat protein (TIGR01451 family)